MNIHDEAIDQILFENNISNEWSDSVKNELKNIELSDSPHRKNLINKPFITIDGADAKDFDDAIFTRSDYFSLMTMIKGDYKLKFLIIFISLKICLPLV